MQVGSWVGEFVRTRVEWNWLATMSIDVVW